MNIETIDNFKIFHKCCTGRLIDAGGSVKRIIHESNLGFVSLIQVAAGRYHLKSDGLFKTGLTDFIVSNEADGHIQSSIIDENVIEVNVLTQEGGSGINNRLFAFFQILVWHSEETKEQYNKIFGF